jgi:hypothetical protein
MNITLIFNLLYIYIPVCLLFLITLFASFKAWIIWQAWPPFGPARFCNSKDIERGNWIFRYNRVMQLQLLAIRLKSTVEIILLYNLTVWSKLSNFKLTVDIHYRMKLSGSLTACNHDSWKCLLLRWMHEPSWYIFLCAYEYILFTVNLSESP